MRRRATKPSGQLRASRGRVAYRMRFAIYVRQGEETFDAVDAVPDQLRRRTLAVRGFDDKAMMTGWEVIEGIGWKRLSNGGSPIRARTICTSISLRRDAMRRGWSGCERDSLMPVLQAWSFSVRPMSALGQKRTFAVQNGMSLL